MLARGPLLEETVLVEEAGHAGGIGELEEVAKAGRRHRQDGRPKIADPIGGLASEREDSLDIGGVLVREVAANRGEIASLGENANVETIAGERLHEWSPGAVLDRCESQSASLIQPTLTGLGRRVNRGFLSGGGS
jgi:hypothetical protein